MSSEAIRKAVTTAFVNGWTATPQTRVVYGSNVQPDFDDSDPWIRVSVFESNVANAEIGTNYQRFTGLVTVQCFVRHGIGDKAVTRLVDAVRALLQNKDLSGVFCMETVARMVGVSGNWYQANADTPYIYDVFS
jgi:Bacteriophage related domain of unknown function